MNKLAKLLLVLACMFLTRCWVNPQSGLVLEANTEQFAEEVAKMVDLQAKHLSDPSWPNQVSKVNIQVVSFNKIVPCGDITALGCTIHYDDNFILRTRIADKFQDTAIPHELMHVYICLHKACDPHHSDSAFWDKSEAAFNEYVATIGQPQ